MSGDVYGFFLIVYYECYYFERYVGCLLIGIEFMDGILFFIVVVN